MYIMPSILSGLDGPPIKLMKMRIYETDTVSNRGAEHP